MKNNIDTLLDRFDKEEVSYVNACEEIKTELIRLGATRRQAEKVMHAAYERAHSEGEYGILNIALDYLFIWDEG